MRCWSGDFRVGAFLRLCPHRVENRILTTYESDVNEHVNSKYNFTLSIFPSRLCRAVWAMYHKSNFGKNRD